jgi:hypothetical protein
MACPHSTLFLRGVPNCIQKPGLRDHVRFVDRKLAAAEAIELLPEREAQRNLALGLVTFDTVRGIW